jgi:F-type H+-transporting ATPase subunit alpha
VQLSLSIVGGRAQPPILKDLSRSLRADYANYVEIVQLSRLSSNVSGGAAATIKKGEAIRAVFQQGHHEIVGIPEMIILLYAVQNGYLDDLGQDGRNAFCARIYDFAEEMYPGVIRAIAGHDEMTPDIEDGLERIVKEYFVHLEHEAKELGQKVE